MQNFFNVRLILMRVCTNIDSNRIAIVASIDQNVIISLGSTSLCMRLNNKV